MARNRSGDFDGAQQVLQSTIRRIADYAGDDPEMGELMRALGQEHRVFAAPMTARALKAAHFASANQLRSRDAMGHSIKRG